MDFRGFLIVFIAFPAFFKAQKAVFSLKPALGLTACQVHGDSYSGFNKVGFMGGLFISAKLKEKLALEFGIIYNQKGAKHNSNPDKGDYKYYFLRLNYIEVPLILRYQPKNRFFITFGPSFGYMAKYYEGTELGNITGYSTFKPFEFSVNAGLGIQLNEKLSFELRSNNSFVTVRPYNVPSNVYYNNFIARTFNNGLYNNIIEIALFYKITPGSKNANPTPP